MTVLEPYQGKRFIDNVEELKIENAKDIYPGIEARALLVSSGTREDIIISSLDDKVIRKIEYNGHDIKFTGRLGIVRYNGDKIEKVFLVGGDLLSIDNIVLETKASQHGRIVDVDTENCSIVLDSNTDIPLGDVLKEQIINVSNTRYICDCTYKIVKVAKAEKGYQIYLETPRLEIATGKVEAVDKENGTFTTRNPIFRQTGQWELTGKMAAFGDNHKFSGRISKVATERFWIDGLKEKELYDETLIIYLGDQGYLLYDHKRFEKHSMWKESIKAPLIVAGSKNILKKYQL